MMIESTGEAAKNGTSGLPQFDAAHFTSEVFWEVITFLLLLALFWRYILPRINAILDERSMLIQNNIENATRNRKESDRLLTEYQRKLDAAHEEAAALMARAGKEIAEYREESTRQLEEDIRRKKQAFKTEIEFTKRQAMKEIKNISAEAAILAAEKLIEKNVDADEAKRLVDDAIREINHLKDKT